MNEEKDSLGDRMKRYENVTRHILTPRMPTIIRIDGRAFHTWTAQAGCTRPYDEALRQAMLWAASAVASDMQGFKLFYHQSDEVSFLLTDYARIESQAWFDGNLQKQASIAASVFTAYFNAAPSKPGKAPAFFDARAFNVPAADVSNYFLWRAKDWERNSLTMYAQAHFSHKQLHGKNYFDKHEMLHSIGKNWVTDVPNYFRNGTFIVPLASGPDDLDKYNMHPAPTFAEIDAIVAPLLLSEGDAGLRDALEELYDWQNGLPLPSQKWVDGWGGAMKKAAAALGLPEPIIK